MKKLFIASLLASTSTLTMAQFNTNGLYVQGNIGASKLEVKDDGFKVKDNNTSYSIAVGKTFGAMRYQVDYTSFGKIEEHYKNGTAGTAGYDEGVTTLKAKASLGVSAIYDFKTNSKLTPYIGGRLGISQLKYNDNSTYLSMINGNLTEVNYSEEIKKTQASVGAVAGVQYTFTPQLALDAGVEYNYLGKVDGIKFNQYGAKVGLRYNF